MAKVYCCQCRRDVDAEIVNGKKVYPTYKWLRDKHFYRCPVCHNYCNIIEGENMAIPDAYIRRRRRDIHAVAKRCGTARFYKGMTEKWGAPFHTGEIRTHGEADRAFFYALQVELEL